jgi:multiple antibiotic resistance protein
MEAFMELFLQQSITFFAILDPIGASAIMLSVLHSNVSIYEVKKVASKVTITIIVAFLVILISGNFVLNMFAIDSNSIKVIGGIVLILMSLNMLKGESKKTDDNLEDKNMKEDLAIIPIAIPLTFGPGMFSTIIILKEQNNNFLDIIAIMLAFTINAILLYFVFKNSIHIKKYLGITGQNIITKIMGLIVGAIAVQFIVSGIIELTKMYL